MAIREPKSQHCTTIQIVGRDSGRRGRIELRSGNVSYFRTDGKNEALSLTYQQLVALLEREIEYRDIDADERLPKAERDATAFHFSSYDVDESGEWEETRGGTALISKVRPHLIDLGSMYLDEGMDKGRPNKKHPWRAYISVHGALLVLNAYIDRWMSKIRTSKGTDENIVITKSDLRRTLLQMVKKLEKK